MIENLRLYFWRFSGQASGVGVLNRGVEGRFVNIVLIVGRGRIGLLPVSRLGPSLLILVYRGRDSRMIGPDVVVLLVLFVSDSRA